MICSVYFKIKDSVRKHILKIRVNKCLRDFLKEIKRVYRVYDTQSIYINNHDFTPDHWLILLEHLCYSKLSIYNLNGFYFLRDVLYQKKYLKSNIFKDKAKICYKFISLKYDITRSIRSRLCYNLCITFSKDLIKIAQQVV